MNIKDFFTLEQRQAIQESIASAEKLCSGEIRVHLSKSCKGEPFNEAIKVFSKLKMYATEQRNGVLIYIAPTDKKIAILGDKGINEKVPVGFWDNAYETMRADFALGHYTQGLQSAILMAGEQLALYFPYSNSDKDELNNDISYGE